MNTLEIKQIKKNFCVVCGVAVLGKFKTEEQAKQSLNDDFELYKYWAGSASVSVQNTPAKVVSI